MTRIRSIPYSVQKQRGTIFAVVYLWLREGYFGGSNLLLLLACGLLPIFSLFYLEVRMGLMWGHAS